MAKAPGGSSVARGFVVALLLLAVSGGQALAHRSPSNCNANRLTLSLDQNPAGNIVSGQTVVYTVGVFNPGPGTGIGCDVTGTTVTFTCPGADGTPSGQTTVLGTGLSFPADNSGDTIFPSVSCKIVVTSGVTSATARAQAGQNTGNRAADLTKGVLHDSAIDDPFVRINDLSLTVNTCVAKVDKQVSCDGGLTFHDVGLVSADDDGHTDLCLGWNAFTVDGTAAAAEAIQVRYVVGNAGTADLLNCSIGEGNPGFPGTVSVGSLAGACVADVDCGNAQATCVNGACVFTSGANSAACSTTLSAAEPDKATVTCDCTLTPSEVQATAFDEANFQCQTPGLTVTKDCALRDTNGNSAVTITVTNTGSAALANCKVTDTNLTGGGCATPPGLPAGESSVAVSPNMFDLGVGAPAVTATGTITGLTQDSCNTVSVTCDIVGSVDPNNPGHPKTLSASAQDTCETCSVKVDKQVKCGAGPFIDVGFETNNEDGTASCLGWNAFTVNGTNVAAEALTVQYVAQNTGGTGLFSFTVTDSNTAISSTAVNIGDVASGGTSTPVPINKTCSDTLDAQEPDTATVSCFCTADLNPNFKATATDTASFDCQTPGLTVTKDCALRDTNGNSAVTITVTNTGSAALANCKVTDTNVTDGSCVTPPGLPAGGNAVSVSPNMFDLGVGAPAVTATGTITGLTQNSCNAASVTCEIVGSVDPNNPGHAKTLTATAQDTCETCSVKVDKQIKCGAGPFIDVGFVSNNEDGTASCLGWNAFTVNGTHTPAETLTVQYVIQNTGGTALFSCTATDSNTVISSTAVPIADMVVVGGTSTPVPINTTCSDTLDASEPDTATVSCFCTADKNANFVATAKDSASFDCQTPGLVVTKDCATTDATSGNNAITITVQNTGTADLENCGVTDTNFTAAACPASGDPTGTSSAVTVSPSTIASLGHGSMATATGTVKDLTNDSCNTATVTCDIKGSQDGQGNAKKLSAKAKDTCEVPICDLAVEKTACVAAAAPPGAGCTGGAIALTLKYTGASISGPTTVTVTGSSRASVTYSLASLNNGDILTLASENDFTIDATAHGQSKLGAKTTVTINGTSEVLHTSCSCRATPETNLALCNPACLDSSSPDNTTGFKGAPSPLWTLVGLKDPSLGTETCGGTVGGGTVGECQTDLPSAGADVTYTYKITNTGTTTVHNVTVEDDKLGTIAGSPVASIAPGGMATLTATQSVAGTTLNTVTVTGNNGFCEAKATAAVVAPCVLGYPFTSPDPRTSVVFNESEVLRAFRPSVARPGERLMVFYNDEHALTLGVRRVLVKTSAGTSMTDYPLSPLTSSPDGVLAPQVGTMALDGDQAGTDTSSCAGFPDLCDRPLFPALFITDITDDPSSRAGDWQFGGTPIAPDAVFGTWKGAVRTVDATRTPPQITVTPDRDPAKNNYNLDGGDAAPTGLTNQGYGAEIVWDVDTLLADGVLQEGRVYRVQFMVHDGDQNKVGGDTGEGCATVFLK